MFAAAFAAQNPAVTVTAAIKDASDSSAARYSPP